MTEKDLYEFWHAIVGVDEDESWSEPADLAFLFQSFRPLGKGAERILNGFWGARQVLPRLLEVYRATASGWDKRPLAFDYFIVTDPPAIAESRVDELIRSYLDKMKQIAAEINYRKTASILSAVERVQIIRAQDAPYSLDLNRTEDLLYAMQSDFFSLTPSHPSELWLLEPAFYSMANDNPLTYHLLWPLKADSSNVEEPFLPYFELWKHAVTLRLEADQATAYIPA